MRRYTERQSFTVPVEVKARLKEGAATRGISLSEYIRRMIDDMIVWHDFDVFMAEREARGATLQ